MWALVLAKESLHIYSPFSAVWNKTNLGPNLGFSICKLWDIKQIILAFISLLEKLDESYLKKSLRYI